MEHPPLVASNQLKPAEPETKVACTMVPNIEQPDQNASASRQSPISQRISKESELDGSLKKQSSISDFI